MKVKLNPLAQDAGNALLTTVIFVMVLTLSIGGYMTYVLQQARMNGRSQAWNMAIAVSEAGVEEGFEHLNDDQTNMAADGWVSLGSGNYSVTRSNLPGTFTSSYTVTLNYANPAEPTITSVATVTPPAVARKAPRPFFYAAVNNQTAPTSVARGVQVILTKPTFFNAAVVAKGSINLNGNRVTVDSFDSGTPGQNVNGQWASSVSGDDGIVASDGGITNSAVTLGNANIYGQLYIGPNEPESVGPNGFVGTHAWVAGGGSGIETGDLHTDANFNFPDTSLPPGYQYYTTPQPGSVLLVNGTNVIAATNNNATIFPTGLTNGQTL
ncbi:MAG TPA: hypothetical protein VKV04_25690, partial [Verrucomicrobiae bacterium]|nr:hypothetical protein [Verrucomicrobiae bacterium]